MKKTSLFLNYWIPTIGGIVLLAGIFTAIGLYKTLKFEMPYCGMFLTGLFWVLIPLFPEKKKVKVFTIGALFSPIFTFIAAVS